MRKKTKYNFIQWLSPHEIDCLMDKLQVVTYTKETELFYKNQVPNVGHLLCHGEIILINNSGERDFWPTGGVIGVRELVHNTPVKSTARIKPGTRVGILDRSTIQEILAGEDDGLKNIILKLC